VKFKAKLLNRVLVYQKSYRLSLSAIDAFFLLQALNKCTSIGNYEYALIYKITNVIGSK